MRFPSFFRRKTETWQPASELPVAAAEPMRYTAADDDAGGETAALILDREPAPPEPRPAEMVDPSPVAAVVDERPRSLHDWLRTAREARAAGRADEAKAALEAAAERFPQEAAVRQDRARLAEADRDWSAAERWWREFALLSPTAAWVVPHIAHFIRLQGRLADAETWVGDALERFPNDAALFVDHARMAEMRRDWAAAATRWHEVVARFPDRWEGPVGEARVLREDGQTEPARVLLEQTAERFPGSAGPLQELARMAEAARDWPAAERWWRASVALDPAPWWCRAGVVMALREQGRFTDAEAMLVEQIEQAPHEAWSFMDYARLAERTGDWGAAANRWGEVISRFPDRWDGFGGRAKALREMGQAAEARVALIDAAERFPAMSSPLLDLARLAEAQRDWPAAEGWWRRFIALEPALWWGYVGRANALREQGRFDAAEAVLLEQLDRLPGEAAIAIEYGRLAEWSRNWMAAGERWDMVVARFPALWDGYRGQARALREVGRLDDARAVLLDALRRFPRSSQPMYDLAVLAEVARDWGSAVQYWREAVELEPGVWWFHQRLAAALREQGQLAAAAGVLTVAMAAFPREVQLAVAFAQLGEADGDGSEALERWRGVHEQFPLAPAAASGYAQALRQAGRLDEAAVVLGAATERFPSHTDLLFRAAFLAEARGQLDAAAAFAERAIALEPGAAGHYIGLSGLHSRQSELVKAEAVLTRGIAATGERADLLLELARMSERKGDWSEASERFRDCYEKYPQELAAATGLATMLYRQGAQAEAEDLLGGLVERYPENSEIAIAYARLPHFGGLAKTQEFLARGRELVSKFPDKPEAHRLLVDALLFNHLDAEAETTLRDAIRRFPDEKILSHQLSTALVRQEKWDAAFAFFEDELSKQGPNQTLLRDYAAALITAKRWDVAQRVIQNAITRFPTEHALSIGLFDILVGRGDLDAATLLWKELQAKSANAPLLRRDLFDRRALLIGLGHDPADVEAGKRHTTALDGDVRIEDIVTRFESMGGHGLGCEFGIFQRHYGAEPLGLLRWTEMQPDELATALEMEFQGVGSPEQTVLRMPEHGAHIEYGASDRRFGMYMHTFVRADQVPEDKMFVQLCRRLSYLRGKFLDDLREGNKIFVYKNAHRNLTNAEIDRIYRAVRAYGDTTFLYVRLDEEQNRFPLVESPEPGLLIGHIDRFSVGRDGTQASLPATSWAAIALNAYRMWQPGAGVG